MSLRLDQTAASGDSTAWQPAGETILQLKATAGAVVLVQARTHVDAPWVSIATLRSITATPDAAFVRLPRMPYLQLSVARNTAGQSLKVWDNE